VIKPLHFLSLLLFAMTAPPVFAENRIAYVAFPTLGDPSLWEGGKLTLPPAPENAKLPAVVIVHGSAGVDRRGPRYAEALAKAGIATLEIDMWSARGTKRGAAGRPKGVPETLPDAYGALKFLAGQPEIDPGRVGLMGFSWGGAVTMLSATRAYAQPYAAQGLSFKAHAAFYPVCWIYDHLPGYGFTDLATTGLLLQAGAADDYDEGPQTCTDLAHSLPPADRAKVELRIYPGAGHGFDRAEEPLEANDPFSHKGKGGVMHMKFEPKAAAEALRELVAFFSAKL
jgi:dienelactone hydrolase